MKRIWVFILFLILSQSHKVARSQSDCLSDSASLRPYDFYENQIRLADSLYKNYLPQSNFEEVKKAMEFFDSVQLLAISRQHRGLFDKKADNENMLIAESRLLTAAKAHYYHAVGLTERDDIVGACEHYLCALEIMEPLVETSPLWRLMTKDKGLMAKDKRLKVSVAEPVETPNDGVVPSTNSGTAYPKTVDRCLLTIRRITKKSVSSL